MLNILQYPSILENVLKQATLQSLVTLAQTCQEMHRRATPVLYTDVESDGGQLHMFLRAPSTSSCHTRRLTVQGSLSGYTSALHAKCAEDPSSRFPALTEVHWVPDRSLLDSISGIPSQTELDDWRRSLQTLIRLTPDRFIIHGPPIILHALFSDLDILPAPHGSSIVLLINEPGDYSSTFSEPFFDSAQLCPDEPVSFTVVLDERVLREGGELTMAYPRLSWPVERLVYAIWAGVVRVDFVGFRGAERDVCEDIEVIEEMVEGKQWVRLDLRNLARYCRQKGDQTYDLSRDKPGTLACYRSIAEWGLCRAGVKDCCITV